MPNKVLALLAVLTVLATSDMTAQSYTKQGKPCADKTGQARTDCLNEEVRRGAAETAAIDAKLARLTRAMNNACQAAAAMDKTADVARTAGTISQAKPLEYGGRTWTSVRAVMTALTREKKNCEDARRAMDKSRKGD